jgi:hypothetical protein
MVEPPRRRQTKEEANRHAQPNASATHPYSTQVSRGAFDRFLVHRARSSRPSIGGYPPFAAVPGRRLGRASEAPCACGRRGCSTSTTGARPGRRRRSPARTRRHVRGLEPVARPFVQVSTTLARAGRAEPHALRAGPWESIAKFLLLSTSPRRSTPWRSRKEAGPEKSGFSAVSRTGRCRSSGRSRDWRTEYERLHVCFEAGPTGYGLYRQIQALGHDCMVVAPALIPKRSGERVKTNRRDAVTLARLHRAGELTGVWSPDAAHEAVRDLVRVREAAADDHHRAYPPRLSVPRPALAIAARAHRRDGIGSSNPRRALAARPGTRHAPRRDRLNLRRRRTAAACRADPTAPRRADVATVRAARRARGPARSDG